MALNKILITGSLLLIAGAGNRLSAQTEEGSVRIYADPALEAAVNARIAQRETEGTMDGYRFLLYFSNSRTEANKRLTQAKNQFGTDCPVILKYEEPYFKVYYGTYRNRFEAELDRGKLDKIFKGCNLVNDKIPFPAVP